MDEQKKLSDIEEAAAALIANSEDENPAYKSINKQKSATSEEKNDKKIFKKYKIKDIVFLAIITACTLITGAVMPLLVNVPFFGIVQFGTSIFDFSRNRDDESKKAGCASVSVDIYICIPDFYVPADGSDYRVRACFGNACASYLPRV